MRKSLVDIFRFCSLLPQSLTKCQSAICGWFSKKSLGNVLNNSRVDILTPADNIRSTFCGVCILSAPQVFCILSAPQVFCILSALAHYLQVFCIVRMMLELDYLPGQAFWIQRSKKGSCSDAVFMDLVIAVIWYFIETNISHCNVSPVFSQSMN